MTCLLILGGLLVLAVVALFLEIRDNDDFVRWVTGEDEE